MKSSYEKRVFQTLSVCYSSYEKCVFQTLYEKCVFQTLKYWVTLSTFDTRNVNTLDFSKNIEWLIRVTNSVNAWIELVTGIHSLDVWRKFLS